MQLNESRRYNATDSPRSFPGHRDKCSPFRQPPTSSSEPPQLHIVDQFSFDAASSTRQTSPPKAIVDSSPLQLAMDKNKECEYHGEFIIAIIIIVIPVVQLEINGALSSF